MSKTPRNKKCFVGMVVANGVENAGGIGRVIGYTMEAWENSPNAITVHLYDPRGSGSIMLFPFFLLATLFAITWHKISGRLALLHVNMASRGSALRKYFIVSWAHLLGVPVVLHLHGGKFDTFYPNLGQFFQKRVREIFARSTHVITLGAVWKSFLVENVCVAPKKISVIANGVPAPKHIEKKPTSEECHILFLGRLGTRKGVPELLEALASLSDENLKWRATLAGDGDVDLYKKEAKRLGLEHNLTFPGWVDQNTVASLLSEADILVLPSHAENLPVAILEGLSYSLPIVVTPVGALPEMLTDGKDALFVPIGDAKKLAEALRKLLVSPFLRTELGENAFTLFQSKIDVRNTADEISKIYHNILD